MDQGRNYTNGENGGKRGKIKALNPVRLQWLEGQGDKQLKEEGIARDIGVTP